MTFALRVGGSFRQARHPHHLISARRAHHPDSLVTVTLDMSPTSSCAIAVAMFAHFTFTL
jgi:hypothetical protein